MPIQWIACYWAHASDSIWLRRIDLALLKLNSQIELVSDSNLLLIYWALLVLSASANLAVADKLNLALNWPTEKATILTLSSRMLEWHRPANRPGSANWRTKLAFRAAKAAISTVLNECCSLVAFELRNIEIPRTQDYASMRFQKLSGRKDSLAGLDTAAERISSG